MASTGAPPQPARDETQNYANHTHRPVATSVAGVFTIAAFAVFAVMAFRQPSLASAGGLLLSCGVMTLVVISRTYTVRLQNRIIRLEILRRLERLGRAEEFARLSMPQIAALRFASDAELPALLDRAVTEHLTADQIKRAVTVWQPDNFRT